MDKLENAPKLSAKLRAMSLGRGKSAELEVGYSAPYAIYVHEDMEVVHLTGQAKFLSGPFRRYRAAMGRLVVAEMRKKKGLAFALEKAGRYLIELSRPLVPVDTGFLRDSAYVRVKR